MTTIVKRGESDSTESQMCHSGRLIESRRVRRPSKRRFRSPRCGPDLCAFGMGAGATMPKEVGALLSIGGDLIGGVKVRRPDVS